MATLVQAQTGQRITLKLRNLVGRSSKCELHLPNPNISSEHALIWWDGDCWWLRDLGSRNGTSTDGRALEGETPARLEVGMVITFAQQLGWTVESLSAPVSRGVPISFDHSPSGPLGVPTATAGAHSGPISTGPTSASTSAGRNPERELDRRLLVSNVRVLESSSGFYDVVFDLDWREAFRYGDYWNAAWVFLKQNPAEVTAVVDEQALVNHLVEDTTERHRTDTTIARAKASAGRVFDLLTNRNQPGTGPGHSGATPHPSAFDLSLNLAQSIVDRFEPSKSSREIRLERSMIAQGPEREVSTEFAVLTVNDDAPATITSFTRWSHMPISTTAADHSSRRGIEITPSEDGLGVFVHRDQDCNFGEALLLRDIRIRTSTRCTGIPIKVWVGALEMVLIPEGEFHVGDPKGAEGPTSCFYQSGSKADDKSFVIRSEQAIPVGTGPGELCWDNRNQMGEFDDIPAAYPKGFASFYILKHQITQGEYCDFLNHLHSHQLTIRYPYGGQGDYRYTVYKTTTRTRVCTRPERPCNWVSWGDAAAYIWWAGLRPMTEFEYEKACRGTEPPVADEFAWGSTTLFEANVIVGDESRRPIVQGNANIGGPLRYFAGGDGEQGPVPDDSFHVTGFAPDAEATFPPKHERGTYTWREETGASFYGVMGLTGNLWEYVITVGTVEGRAFQAEYGTGNLDPKTGAPDRPSSWPGANHLGVGFRGGSWYTVVEAGQVANRRFGSGLTGYSDRSHDTGFRAVRTAPRKR
jgi:formylglycine-generating enzyme required for sulfatase activity